MEAQLGANPEPADQSAAMENQRAAMEGRFHDRKIARDVPASLMCVVADRQKLTSALQLLQAL